MLRSRSQHVGLRRYHHLGMSGCPCDTRRVERTRWAARTAVSSREAPVGEFAFFNQRSGPANLPKTTFYAHTGQSALTSDQVTKVGGFSSDVAGTETSS